jgi:hypothetical protein
VPLLWSSVCILHRLFSIDVLLLRSSNNAIVDNNNEYENCEKWVNTLYLNMLNQGIHNIDSATIAHLGYLSQQCPAAYGTCVYAARSLLAGFMPGVQYNDDSLMQAML